MSPALIPWGFSFGAINGTTTMTSREIGELTGKDHFNVLIDIRKMLSDLEIDVLSFQAMSPDSYGRPQPLFALPKDLTITLVSGYSVPMRHRIVTRWMELVIDALSFEGMFTGAPRSLSIGPRTPSKPYLATWVA